MSLMDEKMEAYAVAENACPGMHATAAVFSNSLGLYKVFCESKDGRERTVMVTRDGVFAGYGGKAAASARDMPGQKNKSRRSSLNAWGSRNKQAGFGRRTLTRPGSPLNKVEPEEVKRSRIGRRKTVRSKAGRLISRKSQKAVKRSMFRMQQKAKLLACHACNRNDFATEKSLKRHTEKFHTPGQKSPRGFRTRRDPNHTCERCGRKTEALPQNGKQSLYREESTGKYVCHGCYGRSDSDRKKTGWRSRSTRRLYRGSR